MTWNVTKFIVPRTEAEQDDSIANATSVSKPDAFRPGQVDYFCPVRETREIEAACRCTSAATTDCSSMQRSFDGAPDGKEARCW